MSVGDDEPATVVDSSGRRVSLTPDRWGHIVDGHPELAACRDAVLATVAGPGRALPGPRHGEEWFYREGVGPSRWLKVVVAYAGGEGQIVTAFARRRLP